PPDARGRARMRSRAAITIRKETALTAYTQAMPGPAITRPARVGPATEANWNIRVLSPIALARCSRGTRLGMSAWRAGPSKEAAGPQGGEGGHEAARERQTHRCQATRADTAEPATRPSLDVEVGWITFKAIAMMHSRGRFQFLGSVIIVCAAAMSARQAPAQVPARPTPATPAGRGERAPDYPERPPAPPEQIARGQQLFKSNCSFCHGSDARGGETGPNLVRDQVVLADQGGELIAPVVQNGIPGRGMPKLTLSATEIADIAAWLHSQPLSDRGAPSTLDILV